MFLWITDKPGIGQIVNRIRKRELIFKNTKFLKRFVEMKINSNFNFQTFLFPKAFYDIVSKKSLKIKINFNFYPCVGLVRKSF